MIQAAVQTREKSDVHTDWFLYLSLFLSCKPRTGYRMPFHNDLWQGNQAVAAFYWRREGNLITDHLSTRIYHICVSLFCFFALTWFLIVIGFLICMDTKIWTQIDCLWSGDVFSVDSCLDSFPEFIYFWSVKCTQFNIFKQQRVKPLLQWKMRHHGDF